MHAARQVWNRLQFLRRDDGGQAMVEFALVSVPLLLIVVGIVQFGFYYQAREAVRDGVRAAARQASLCRSWTGSTATPATVYTGIVGSSVSTPPALTVKWADGTTDQGASNPLDAGQCAAGGAVIVSTSNTTYSANFLGISIPFGSLNQSAEAIIE